MIDLELKNGNICGLISDGINNADPNGATGSVGFTLMSDNIKDGTTKKDCSLYTDTTSCYDFSERYENEIICRDSKNAIETRYIIGDNILTVTSRTDNYEISQFAINLDLNFLEKDTDYKSQLLPTSPYKSSDGKHFYYILTRPDGKVMTVLSEKPCDGFRIYYSPYKAGHYILRLQIMASFDRAFGGSGYKDIELKIFWSENIGAAFERISQIYDLPLFKLKKSGVFDGYAQAELVGKCDRYILTAPDGTEEEFTPCGKIENIKLNTFGFYTITPFVNEKQGLDAVLWCGKDDKKLFDKCTGAIKKPYHNDDNLCEGGCFLWSMLCNMRVGNHRKYDDAAKYELGIIMGKNGERVQRKTIVPERTEYAPYHICGSNRIQEQFFGVSILLEAYKTYNDKKYLDYAEYALDELLDNWFSDGMIYNGEDYTTVCAPVIAIADMANATENPQKKKRYHDSCIAVAEYLLRRGINFPTEGTGANGKREFEDGSISCTALSVLYVCANIHYDERYISFARDILELHKAWTIYTPDARMYGSSFRWWETIWEGDGEGPAICAGHAWTVWKAEALYWYGVLTGDKSAMEMSWCGFVTNFAKANKNGEMYSCFEVDYIRGGGIDGIKKDLKQLADNSFVDSFKTAHSYPAHIDSSLSRYAWVRYAYTFLNGRDDSNVLTCPVPEIQPK